jgi:hypothetical protein
MAAQVMQQRTSNLIPMTNAVSKNGRRVVRLYGSSIPHTGFVTRPDPKPARRVVMLYGGKIPHSYVA